MGKVKSVIITVILVAAIVVLGFFATVSFPWGDISRYNAFIGNIHLGSDLTGDCYALIYPEGVISSSDYYAVVNDEDNVDERDEYKDKYLQRGGVFVDKQYLGYAYDADTGAYESAVSDARAEEEYKAGILADAKIISERFGDVGLTSYSVSVQDGFVIKLSAPSGFTYAAYKGYDATSNSNSSSAVNYMFQYLSYGGELTLRTNGDSTSTEFKNTVNIIPIKDNFAEYFSGASYYALGGVYAVKLNLTTDGQARLNKIITSYSGDSTNAYFYVGETALGPTLTLGEDGAITSKTMYFQADDEASARNLASVLGSVIGGSVLTNTYGASVGSSSIEVIAATPTFGENAPIWLGVAILVLVLAAIIYSVVRYRKLGVVNALMILVYSLALIIALMLLEIQLTVAGAFVAVLGLALLTAVNTFVFEAVRKETQLGRTIYAAVKTGYKKTWVGILDLHIVLVVVSMMFALIGVGEVAACGFIFFIASIASYVLYWFTRFIWYALSSPARDKFAFCGFAREEDDED